MSQKIGPITILVLTSALCGMSARSLAASPADQVDPKAPIKARTFDLKQVRLLDGPFNNAMQRDQKYLHALESDRLLHGFRTAAGLPAPGKPMGGWELNEVRGHSLGHYLSACAMIYASCGDEKLKAKADAIVAELAKCQQALGRSGYLSAFPESFIERAETVQQVWAPYYVLHKIMAGMFDMATHCDNRQALEIVEGMAQWCKSRCDKLSDEQMQRMLDTTEQGGMNEVLANLHGVTGNPDHLALAQRFNQASYNRPLAAGRDELKGLHVNSFIPNMVGTARQYELTGKRSDHNIAHFFWHQVVAHRCYSTGGTSNFEHWRTDPDHLATELSTDSQESCCTYNMLKLTRHLFSWYAEAVYADYYERALFNSILSTQDPESGMMMYFVALNPGHWKAYNTPRDSFWCCTGTGMENHAKYGEGIYFHDDRGVFVNLFIASELDWPERGIRLRQETNFPVEEGTSLVVKCQQPVELALRIRIPYWATEGVTLTVNGEKQPTSAKPASYVTLDRTWRDGDRVEMSMPMSLWLAPMPDDSTLATVMYGPLVLAGELGTENLTPNMFWLEGQRDQSHGPGIGVPMFVIKDQDPTAWIERVDGRPLAFRTVGVGRPEDVSLVPYHMLFGQRYSIYWRIVGESSPELAEILAKEETRRRLAARRIDEVAIGHRGSEESHAYKGKKAQTGPHLGRHWRHATDGGFFSYALAVSPDEPTTLRCTYWGSDSGRRTFDIQIDGRKIATQTLQHDKPGEFFDVDYELPVKLTKGKSKVTIKFQAHPGNMAGGLFGAATLR